MNQKFLIILTGGLVSALAPAAMSAPAYSFQVTTGTPVNIGGGQVSVPVHISILETLNGSPSFADDPRQRGLTVAMLTVQRASGDSSRVTFVTQNAAQFTETAGSGVFLSDVFTPWTSAASPGFFVLGNVVALNATAGVPFGGSAIWMGDMTVTFDAGMSAAQYKVSSYEPGYISTFGGMMLDVPADSAIPAQPGWYDPTIDNGVDSGGNPIPPGGYVPYPADAFVPVSDATFTVAVPEPAILGLAAATSIVLFRRRSHEKQAKPSLLHLRRRHSEYLPAAR